MDSFSSGVIASLVAMGVWKVTSLWLWPAFHDGVMYRGVRIDGKWEIQEERSGEIIVVGQIELKQSGRRITGNSVRLRRRDGKKSDRKFNYKGHIDNAQVTLLWEDPSGVGFDVGSYVFLVQKDMVEMLGLTTFHDKDRNKIISEPRTLRKVPS